MASAKGPRKAADHLHSLAESTTAQGHPLGKRDRCKSDDEESDEHYCRHVALFRSTGSDEHTTSETDRDGRNGNKGVGC